MGNDTPKLGRWFAAAGLLGAAAVLVELALVITIAWAIVQVVKHYT